jgi:hypothetical protein
VTVSTDRVPGDTTSTTTTGFGAAIADRSGRSPQFTRASGSYWVASSTSTVTPSGSAWYETPAAAMA